MGFKGSVYSNIMEIMESGMVVTSDANELQKLMEP